MQQPHERKISMIILRTYFISEVVKWGIRQNPYAGQLPRNIDVVIEKLHQIVPDIIETDDIRLFTHTTLEQIPEVRDWNLSQVERERGITVDDPTRAPFMFTSRYDQPKPEYDFIDLDALKQNIARSLKREAAEYT